MDNDVAAVQQDPAAGVLPLPVVEPPPGASQRPLHLLGNAIDLPGGVGATDDEIVGKGRQLAEVQQQDVRSLLFGAGFNRCARQLQDLQTSYLRRS